jgi:hypothetical protein
MNFKEKTKNRIVAAAVGAILPVVVSYKFKELTNEFDLFTEIKTTYWLCLKSMWTGRNELVTDWLSEDEKMIKDIIE